MVALVRVCQTGMEWKVTANGCGVSVRGHEKCSRTSCDDGYTTLDALETLNCIPCVCLCGLWLHACLCVHSWVRSWRRQQSIPISSSIPLHEFRGHIGLCPLFWGYRCTHSRFCTGARDLNLGLLAGKVSALPIETSSQSLNHIF